MSSAFITPRRTKSGRRYAVRYRVGGRTYPIVHGGSFRTEREARTRRDFIAGELAAGRNPADALRAITSPPKRRTLADWGASWAESRVDVSDKTRVHHHTHRLRIDRTLGDRDPQELTPADVQEWVAANADLAPASLRGYIGTLRQVLDFAGVEPNPARDRKVRLPRVERTVVEPPSGEQVDAILRQSPKRWRLPLRTLEQSGMRVGELHALEWRDVDVGGSQLRIRAGKTRAARRLAAVPEWLMVEIAETCPPDDRTPDRRVFPGFTPDVAQNAMARACTAAGIPHFHPHDLRHRYASVKLKQGVPLTELAAQLGHARKSLTLDTYSHVMLDEA